MKVVVTGGAGFIGSHITDALLSAGHDVTVVDDFSAGRNENLEMAFEISQKNGLKFRVLRASVCEKTTWDSLEPADAIFHFAAQTSVTDSVADPKKDFKINVIGGSFLLDWVRKKGVRTVVYANTAGAMYGRPSHFPTNERSPPAPLSPYGATKAFFEIYLSSICDSFKASGEWSSNPTDKNYFSWASLRLSNVYGPRQITKGEAGVVPIFVETMGRGERPTIFGNGSKTRDYIHVSDVCSAAMKAFDKIQKVHLDEGFNIATGLETPDSEVFHAVMRALHDMGSDPDSPEPYKNSLKVSEANFADVRPGEVLRSVLDIGKAEAILAWRPRMTWHQGVKETVQKYFSK
jgi:UDP-glucose 4-epimerase